MHTHKSLFLTIDQGGHACRAMVYDINGDMVAQCEASFTTHHPAAYFVEHDANELIVAIQHCITQIAEQLGERVRYLEAAGLATQRSNVLCWDRQTRIPLSPVISWQDTRAQRWLAELDLDREDIHKNTGLFPSAHYGASKLRWCLDNLPAVQEARQQNRLQCGPMSSYLAMRLTDASECYADPVSASRTLLWHLHRKDWDAYLLNCFGIEREWLPQCVPTEFAYGMLNVAGTEIPLKIVTGDQSAAMYAYGDLQYETGYVNIGTGAFVSRPSGYALLYARRLLTSVIQSDASEAQYVIEGTVNGAGSAIEWLQSHSPVDHLWDQLPAWLNDISNPPLFLNGVAGLAAPYWLPDFETSFNTPAATEARYVSVIESIVFLLHANVQEMMKFASPPQQLQVSGGLARLDGLCQRLSDLTRLPVYRPDECEATARGTAYLVAGRPVHWPENQHGKWFSANKNALLDNRFLLWEQSMLQRMRHEQAA